MRTIAGISLCLVLSILLSSCATITKFNKPKLKGTTGYFMPKAALSSLTGQAVIGGEGLLNAIYPIGWSQDGKFAYIIERKCNDMDTTYKITLYIYNTSTEHIEDTTGYELGSENWNADKANFAFAWLECRENISNLLKKYRIIQNDASLLPFPIQLHVDTVTTSWEKQSVGSQINVELELLLSSGKRRNIYSGTIEDYMESSLNSPKYFKNPFGDDYAILIEMRDSAFEGMVDVDYVIQGTDFKREFK